MTDSERKADPHPEHTYEFILQETDLDTFGHLNHANYLVLFEQARWQWITSGGFGLSKIQELQVGPTILGVQVQYKREIKHRERIQVLSWCPNWRGKVGTVVQKMMNERGEECCRIELTIALFDMQKRKIIAPLQEWLSAVGKSAAEPE